MADLDGPLMLRDEEPSLSDLREDIAKLAAHVMATSPATKSACACRRLGVPEKDASLAIEDLARAEYRCRRARQKAFDGLNFDREPAWDIILDLASRMANGGISVTSACIASAVPLTTALRHLGELERAGLIEIKRHPTDARARIVTLSDRGSNSIRRYFESVTARARNSAYWENPAEM